MCGIFGFYTKKKSIFSEKTLGALNRTLIFDAQERGKDAAGVLFSTGSEIEVFKRVGLPEEFVTLDEFLSLEKKHLESKTEDYIILGQCRLVMSGTANDNHSNQPIVSTDIYGVHNGIIVSLEGNKVDLRSSLNNSSDSKIFFDEIAKREDLLKESSVLKGFLESSKGSLSIAYLDKKNSKIVIYSNTGSLYYASNENSFLFASEKRFVKNALKELGLSNLPIHQLKDEIRDQKIVSPLTQSAFIQKPLFKEITRCTRCILPQTYPFIHFDNNGVCNFCLNYEKQKLHGEEALLRKLEPYRSKDGSPDILVGLSGGRDSSYGMYMLKKKYGMNPIAYTFDWGLTTDVSRRNQAIVCGKLGIEHILRAPDIDERRRHVQKNVEAFLKRPHLGMVPLFMAGDKDFYHYGRQLKKELGLKLTVHCTGHEVERLHFKTGFCGVDDSDQHNVRLYSFTLMNKLKLAFFYASQYALNPSYINESLYYSVRAFAYSFLHKDNFIYLYEYIPWNEKIVMDTIINELGWEADESYGKNQWRMGDGQTAFTNYIYHTVAGFSEFDNFRSNQVRAGLIDRAEALRLAKEDNIPKIETLKYFASVVGINLDATLKRINNIPKAY